MENCKPKLSGEGLRVEAETMIPSPYNKPIVGYVNGTYPLKPGTGVDPKFSVSELNMHGKK
jgi:hypothetical protein